MQEHSDIDPDDAIAALRSKKSKAQGGMQERWAREQKGLSWQDRRPRKEEIKSAQLNLKVTPRFRAAVFAAAQARNTSASVLMELCYEFCIRDQRFADYLEEYLGRGRRRP